MKFISIILLFVIFSIVGTSVYAQGRHSTVSVKVHTEKTVPRAGFKIKFVEMVEDSRCPTGTTCVWAGNAKVKIEVRGRKNGSKTFELNSTTAPTVVSYGGYDIKLSGLTPKPATNVRINPSGYVATFDVSRSGK
jgi:hypothetical protein